MLSKLNKIITLLFLMLFGLGITPAFAQSTAQLAQTADSTNVKESIVIYLVRHAEKADDGTRNPPLTEEGQARAERLNIILADAGVTHLYSTDFKRTQETVAPLAIKFGLEVATYSPYSQADMESFAAQLKETAGRHVVSGHSNTTPTLVHFLGGDPGNPISESEYTRLYIITISPAGVVSTVLLHF